MSVIITNILESQNEYWYYTVLIFWSETNNRKARVVDNNLLNYLKRVNDDLLSIDRSIK